MMGLEIRATYRYKKRKGFFGVAYCYSLLIIFYCKGNLKLFILSKFALC